MIDTIIQNIEVLEKKDVEFYDLEENNFITDEYLVKQKILANGESNLFAVTDTLLEGKDHQVWKLLGHDLAIDLIGNQMFKKITE